MRLHQTILCVLPMLTLPFNGWAADNPQPGGTVTAFQQVGATGLKGWVTDGGDWTAANGRLVVRNPDASVNAVAIPRKAPFLPTQTIEAVVNVQARLTPIDWSMAGITLYESPQEFWTLCLTEDAAGKRYVDFLENSHGIWQAQATAGPTHIQSTPSRGTGTPWKPGHDYRMRLTLQPSGISATITDPLSNEVIATGAYTFGQAEAVRQGTAGLIARGCAVEFGDVAVRAPAAALIPPSGIQAPEGRLGTIAMLRDALPGMDLPTVDSLAGRLRAAGFGVTFLSAQNVTNLAALDPGRFPLYMVPNAAVYPAAGGRALSAYLRRGGHLILLGGPPLSHPVWMKNGEWLDPETVKIRLAKTPADHPFMDFKEGQDLAGWLHNTNDTGIPTTISIDPAGPEGKGASLKITAENFTGWSTYSSPPFAGRFAPGQELLTFWAKGDAQTPQLSVEMDETDGSRWIAVTPLTTDWTYHVLSPDDFHFWRDSNTRVDRGGAGDRFNPQNAARLVLGLATSHTNRVGAGPHTFWVARLGTAANPYAGLTTAQAAFPSIETAYPSYKTYPLTGATVLEKAPSQVVLPILSRRLSPPALGVGGQRQAPDDWRLPVVGPAFSAIERPMGKGFDNHPRWRWIPLLAAMDAGGMQRGTAAWILLNETMPFAGSAVAVFGVQDQAMFQNPMLAGAVVDAAKRLQQGVFLAEAGAKEFSYFPGEKVELGATVVNWGQTTRHLQVTMTARAKYRSNILFRAVEAVTVDPGDSMSVTRTWQPGNGAGPYSVTTTLSGGGQEMDTISHDFSVLSTAAPAPDDFVTVNGSNFMLHGKKWNPVGVNFWPLSASGLEPGDYRNHWLARGFYDPDEVERDLNRVMALHMNMVSIQMRGVDNIRNTLDFLRRCDRHGIKVNGFLDGASPLDFHPDMARSIIQAGHLDQNSTLFAYDTIWEPGNSVFNAQGRLRWDRDWAKWIVNRYGSVENAEADWGMPVPRLDGNITSPSDPQMSQQGPWRGMVASYRRFMDDLISRKWNDASRGLRAMDPHHLISFRQGNTLPQDFAFTGPVKHIDFISPEGYSIPAGEKGYNAAAFTIRYIHFTTGGKPVFWAEFGRSVWNGETMQPDPAAFPGQASYIELFNRASLDAGANGLAPWWWPGGYRVDEKSDFGIMNPDGTPRPAAKVIASYADRLEAPRTYPAPDTWLTVDRDAHPGGYWWTIFHEGAEAYARAHAAGQNLGVRTAGTGTDSANTPLIAVGNVPYNGHNPLKYLNAEFNWLQVQDRDGKWVDVQDGATIPVAAGKPVRMRASVGNTEEATWLAAAGGALQPGAVYLATPEGAAIPFRQPIPANTPYLKDADLGEFQLTPALTTGASITLQMTAEGRAWFGEKRTFTLAPG